MAAVPSQVYKIDRVTFKRIIATASHSDLSRVKDALKRDGSPLAALEDDQLEKVAEVALTQRYNKGDQIIKKGERGDVFYYIESGSVLCTNIDGQSNNRLSAGDYFGEQALIQDVPRKADVYSDEAVVDLIAIHRDDFDALLGGLGDVLKQNHRMRQLLCVPVMAQLAPGARNRLLNSVQLVKYDAGVSLCDTGAEFEGFHILSEGTISVQQGGKQISQIQPVTAIGAEELASGSKSRLTYKAEVDIECFFIAKDIFLDVLAPLVAQMKELEAGAAAGSGRPEMDSGAGQLIEVPFKNLQQKVTLGTGTFGRVKLVVDTTTQEAYALKMLQKAQIVALRQQRNVMNEKRILLQLNHPFILKLLSTYKDKNRLYMLMELVQGGEVFSRLQSQGGSVPISDGRFYAACVLDAMEYMHDRFIVYRDLKPENLLIDSSGHVKVVDFGFAKVVTSRTYTLCGTPEYLAPELVLGKGHGKGVDYWALGILIYEMAVGYSPFADHERGDQMVICKNILKQAVMWPKTIRDRDLKTCVEALLSKDTSKRLGLLRGGTSDVKDHAFFKRPKQADWASLRSCQEKTPWRPPLKSATDTSNFDPYEEDDYVEPYRDDGSGWERDF